VRDLVVDDALHRCPELLVRLPQLERPGVLLQLPVHLDEHGLRLLEVDADPRVQHVLPVELLRDRLDLLLDRAVRGSLQRVPSGFIIAEPKTASSRRRVSLTPAGLVALRQHRTRQSEERLRLGAAWQKSEMVFTDEAGKPIDATKFLRNSLAPLLKRAGLPPMRFHDLRRTAATLLLGRHIHPKIVSEMLGHSQIGITLDLYSHVTPTMQREATEAMDAIVGG
jgi:integrase